MKAGEQLVLVAFLTQNVASLISAAQRLMPLGQMAAMTIMWQIKPQLAQIAKEISASNLDQAFNFAPLSDISSMVHPYLPVRLFLS